MDSIVPMAYGNLALDLISKGMHGRLVILRNGRYDNAPIDIVTSSKNWLTLTNSITLIACVLSTTALNLCRK